MKQPLKSKNNKKEHEFSRYKKIIKSLTIVLSGVIISNILIYNVIQGAIINGYSMWPTYEDSDYVFVDKLSWKVANKSKLKRFDVIVCTSDYNNGELLIKRVIGLPGETVHIDMDGKIYINGEPIDDPWGFYNNKTNFLALDITKELGDEEYFVCGDNRNGSLDSRFDAIGNIQLCNIVGRVIDFK